MADGGAIGDDVAICQLLLLIAFGKARGKKNPKTRGVEANGPPASAPRRATAHSL